MNGAVFGVPRDKLMFRFKYSDLIRVLKLVGVSRVAAGGERVRKPPPVASGLTGRKRWRTARPSVKGSSLAVGGNGRPEAGVNGQRWG